MAKNITPAKKVEDPWADTSTRQRVIVAGFLGGAASALVKPLREVESFIDLLDSAHFAVLVTAAALGVLGCLLVWLFREGNVQKALTITAGLSALVANVGATVTKADKPDAKPADAPPAKIESNQQTAPSPSLGLLSLFVSSAYAQDPPPIQATTSASSTQPANVSVELNSNQKLAYKVEVLGADQQAIESFEVKEEASMFNARPLPARAAFLRFQTGSLTSDAYPIPAQSGDSTVEVDFNVSSTPKVGIAQVLGKEAGEVPVLKIAVSARPKAPVGTKGWIFLGVREGDQWKSIHIKPEPNGLPKSGEDYAIDFPLNIRSEPHADKSLIGIASTGQRVRLAEIKASDGPVWASMEVISTASPVP